MFYHDDEHVIRRNILLAVEGVWERKGVKSVKINVRNIEDLAKLLHQARSGNKFPHTDGFQKASVYKKAAYFFTLFCTYKPITDIVGLEYIREEIWKAQGDWRNVYTAYLLVKESLRGVSYKNKYKETVLLNEINASPHTIADMVEAFSEPVPTDKFKLAALFFEQMCYKNTPEAQYKPLL